jgi:hypothetical protein
MTTRMLITLTICGTCVTTADAQILGRRARSNVIPYIELVTPASNYHPNPCCDDFCIQPPRIVPNSVCCPPEIHCVPFDNPLNPPAKPNCVQIDFYGPKKDFKGDVEVPILQEVRRESWNFKTISVPIPCCTIFVCIPYEKCWTSTKECQSKLMKVDLEAYMREDRTIDVYVLNVPSLPRMYIQRQKLSEADYLRHFPGAPVPVPPAPRPCQ